MGELGIEMAMQEEHSRAMQDDIGEAKARLEKEMGYPDYGPAPAASMSKPRYRVILDEIETLQMQAEEGVGLLRERLGSVLDRQERDSSSIAAAKQPEEAPHSDLEEYLLMVRDHCQTMNRRLISLTQDLTI